jgi:hypothetical protein
VSDDREPTNDELTAILKRQLLEIAISSDNDQFKLDVYRGVVDRTRNAKPVEITPPVDAMTIFQQRVKAANGPE